MELPGQPKIAGLALIYAELNMPRVNSLLSVPMELFLRRRMQLPGVRKLAALAVDLVVSLMEMGGLLLSAPAAQL